MMKIHTEEGITHSAINVCSYHPSVTRLLSLRDGSKVPLLPNSITEDVQFSPEGKWIAR